MSLDILSLKISKFSESESENFEDLKQIAKQKLDLFEISNIHKYSLWTE